MTQQADNLAFFRSLQSYFHVFIKKKSWDAFYNNSHIFNYGPVQLTELEETTSNEQRWKRY